MSSDDKGSRPEDGLLAPHQSMTREQRRIDQLERELEKLTEDRNTAVVRFKGAERELAEANGRTEQWKEEWRVAIGKLEAPRSATQSPTFPLAPTREMVEAGAQRLVSWEDGCKWPDSWSSLQVSASRNEAERVWRSMWLAAEAATATEIKSPSEAEIRKIEREVLAQNKAELALAVECRDVLSRINESGYGAMHGDLIERCAKALEGQWDETERKSP